MDNNMVGDTVREIKQTNSENSISSMAGFIFEPIEDVADKHNSSGRETYILDWDCESSSVEQSKSTASINESPKLLLNKDVQCNVTKVSKASSYNKLVLAQETYTQTSKTIIELAETDRSNMRPNHNNTLETQTSFMSIRESKTVEYKIEVNHNLPVHLPNEYEHVCGDHATPKVSNSMTVVYEVGINQQRNSDSSSNNSTNSMLAYDTGNKESTDNVSSEHDEYNTSSEFDNVSVEDADIEEDSLKESYRSTTNDSEHNLKPIDNDITELYNELFESFDIEQQKKPQKEQCRVLTPLTEETTMKKDSLADVTLTDNAASEYVDSDTILSHSTGIPNDDSKAQIYELKLPSIYNGRKLDFLFDSAQCDSELLATSSFETKDKMADRWNTEQELACGENPIKNVMTMTNGDKEDTQTLQLPPINMEGYVTNRVSKPNQHTNINTNPQTALRPAQSSISIQNEIKELKLSHRRGGGNRAESAIALCSDDNKTPDVREKGCEMLTAELLKKLHSQAWYEVTETLEDVPRLMKKFWHVIPEQRIADLIRAVLTQLESPRTQVCRTACHTLASILKNTNYTKKPDFYEAMAVLVNKTGSFSRPVRRAANVALDEIICNVNLVHAISALCVHGTTHKSDIVRCAAARLLVVACALASGGRDLLHTRPPTTATARKYTLRALSALLEDRSMETRKFAERLYSMLRPLANFEAYYLTDVDVELASRQMKKHDQVAMNPRPEIR